MDVYLGTRALLIADAAGAPLHAVAVDGFDATVAALEAWLGERTGRLRLRLWLSGGLCRPFLFAPAAAVRSTDEALRIARALAPERTGLGGPCEVWLDGGGAMAVAIAQPTLARLRALADRRTRVVAIRPWWAELLRAALARDGGTRVVAVHDCDSLTVLGGAGAGDGFALATTLAPMLERDAAVAALTRLLLTLDDAGGAEFVARLRSQEESGQGGERGADGLDCALRSFVELGR